MEHHNTRSDEDGLIEDCLLLAIIFSLFNPVVSNLKDFPFISSMKIPIIKVIEKPLGKEEAN